ncbi:hypothetical protein Pelo_15141 [Pelomyxa schiedti]|nr:hypothetical protein Pelo_15141 [Pelomyxa schiedti]
MQLCGRDAARIATGDVAHVMRVARVLWDSVASQGWLDDPKWPKNKMKQEAPQPTLFSLAEALFPLVALVCSRVLSLSGLDYVGTYRAIAGAASVPSASCVAWIIGHRNQRRQRQMAPVTATDSATAEIIDRTDERVVVKEVAAVLLGLCNGGHVEEARKLFGGEGDGATNGCDSTGSLPLLWDGRCIATWSLAASNSSTASVSVSASASSASISATTSCANDGMKVGVGGEKPGITLQESVKEHVRASCGNYEVFVKASTAGHVPVIRWLVSVLGIPKEEAPWVLSQSPLSLALHSGKNEVAKCLVDEVGFASLEPSQFASMVEWCARGASPGWVKWWAEKFSVVLHCACYIGHLLWNRHSTVEDCKWMEDDIRERGLDLLTLQGIKNADVAKWILSILPDSACIESIVNNLCRTLGDVSLAEWLVTEKHFTPTERTFASACSTRKQGSSLAKWLLNRVAPSQPYIISSFTNALRISNTDVANWLEETFHVMDFINSNPKTAASTLEEICHDYDDKDKVAGLKWFIRRLSQPDKIDDLTIIKAISLAITYHRMNCALMLLDTFPKFDPWRHPLLFKLLIAGVLRCRDLTTLKRLLLPIGSSFSLSSTLEITELCLSGSKFQPLSSKIVKWLFNSSIYSTATSVSIAMHCCSSSSAEGRIDVQSGSLTCLTSLFMMLLKWPRIGLTMILNRTLQDGKCSSESTATGLTQNLSDRT